MAVDSTIVEIDKAMTAQRKIRADLGRLLGLDSSQVTRIFQGKRKLQLNEYTAVMAWLGLSGSAVTESRSGAVVPMPGMVPLYGWSGNPGEARLEIGEQGLRGFVPMHPNQAHIRDAFALEVADITMSPRYEPGEIVYVAPNRWPAEAKDCVVVTTKGDGYLARYVRRQDGRLNLLLLNPREELTLAMADVAKVHAIVGRG